MLVAGRWVWAEDNSAFFSVTGPCNLEFPKDHGPHPGYRIEWWYYTGNLQTESGRQFGFQFTIFRSQISPSGEEKSWPQPSSAWRTQQIYLGHVALSDISDKQHLQAQSIAREALGMAGASQEGDEIAVFINTWSAQISPEKHQLRAHADEFSFELNLVPAKPPVMHGDDGYSRKGSTPERASCYYSFTRLETRGTVTVKGQHFAVAGLSWMDHEFSTAPLEPGLTGWDWFSLQFSDKTEIMAFLFRKKGGGLHPASSGTFIDSSGNARHLIVEEFKVKILDTWKSPRTKAVYPSRWRLQVLPLELDVTISPNLADQEMQTLESTGVAYWEGSVYLKGTKGAKPVEGRGYIELTGYAKPFDAPM